MSAVRNLNNSDVGGRPLRIDLADSDPFLEGKTTVRGELVDGGTPGPSEPRSGWRGTGDSRQESNSLLANLPLGIQVPPGASALDYISSTLANMQPSQLMEVLAQMKAFVITHPEHARTLLVDHPQLAYTLFQGLVLNKIVDSTILQRMAAATSGGAQSMPPQAARPPVPPPHLQQQQQQQQQPQPQYPAMTHQGYPPPPIPQQQAPMPGLAPPPPPSATGMFGHHQHMAPPPQYAGMPPPSYGYRPPPPAQAMPPPQAQAPPPPQPPVTPTPPAADVSEEQLVCVNGVTEAMIMQVIRLPQEQVNAFPETERAAILQLV
ncbi:hypothetical protein C0991_012349 [Blastosporella zonata]|nr:hypothetical protein C0991_012349 [Blastosporella zonata]